MSPLPEPIEAAYADYRRVGDAASLSVLHEAIVEDPRYTRYLLWLPAVEIYLEKCREHDAVRLLEEHLPAGFFSPVVHAYLARGFLALGDQDRARDEEQLAWHALGTMVRSGDGTKQSPWRVLYVDDVHALLAHQQLYPQRQRTDGEHDIVTCTDGATYHFKYLGENR
ncbi:hypothetical protein [uncultured Tessaracoccus sp.]|uniref:hypothetical protein n=1 Tax=uncultured Tessaracoccus sp. TaxID=905023 RepID=UPI002601932D|nr:hypothetical protein [uncultured Tessaracoccus sp.]